MWFFLKYPEYNIPDEELDDVKNYSLINIIVYTYQVRCATHGIIPNGPSLCIICLDNDYIKNSLIKRPTYGKKKHLNKFSCSIGKFN